MPHYFSYGSNMDPAKLLSHCPSAILLGPAQLTNYQLSFTLFSQTRQCGCPDIIPQPGSSVWGALYTLSDPDLLQLDLYEGVPRQKYRRISVQVNPHRKPTTAPLGGCLGEGHLVPQSADCDPRSTIEAYTYEVLHKSPTFQKPSQFFLAQLLASAHQLQLPADYLALLASTPTCD
jgi:gamma-glutamylcyclotransferase (GGCT)/AIG2-like uncharacterized protein YtfP